MIFVKSSAKVVFSSSKVAVRADGSQPFKNQLKICKIKIQTDGSDKRNYRVNFKKIKSLINFKARTIESGIEEIIKEFKNGKFNDYENNFEKYGNYKIDYENK